MSNLEKLVSTITDNAGDIVRVECDEADVLLIVHMDGDESAETLHNAIQKLGYVDVDYGEDTAVIVETTSSTQLDDLVNQLEAFRLHINYI